MTAILALALVIGGALVTRSVWRLGYAAGVKHGLDVLVRLRVELQLADARAQLAAARVAQGEPPQ